MLPKPEKGKNKKLNNNFLSDSEVTQESEEVINAKKVKSKRRLILISLLATVGLSLIFWTFKGIQSFIASPHPINLNFNFDFKLPNVNFKSTPKSSTNISNVDLDEFLSHHNWSVIILKNKNLSTPIYQYNFSDINLNDFLSELFETSGSESSSVVASLPQGLLLQEKLSDSIYGLNINLPDSQLTFVVKDNQNASGFTQDISTFIDQAYWYSVSQN